MQNIVLLCLILQLVSCGRHDWYKKKSSSKKAKKIEEIKPSAKYDNPDFVRDRFKDQINKPELDPVWKDRFKQPFNPAWMDYCDPYHCNDYHKIACGLNRSKMRFKWFQSTCHLILNNQCSQFRGHLQYDLVESKFCSVYVLYLRAGCTSSCIADQLEPICGASSRDGHVALFVNQCALQAANCRSSSLQEYEIVDMNVCEYHLRHA